jgi:hypothetical protein
MVPPIVFLDIACRGFTNNVCLSHRIFFYIGVCEICAVEVGPSQDRVTEIGVAEVCLTEVCAA